MSDELLTVEQAATRIQMHPDTVRRLLREKQIPGVKLGARQWRIPAGALSEFIDRRLGDETQKAAVVEIPASTRDRGIERDFETLANRWKADTRFLSSITDIAMHPAYQRIIGMGPAAVPYVLRELERQPSQWFWALRAITGVDPVADEDRGDVRAMAKTWLRWGRQNHISW